MPHFNDLLTTSKIIDSFSRDVLNSTSYNLVFMEHGSPADESIQPYEVYLYAQTDETTSKDVLYYAVLDENRAVKRVLLNDLLDEKHIDVLAGKIDSDEKSLSSAKKALLTLFSQAGYPVHIPSPLKNFQTKVLHCFLPNLGESASPETIIAVLRSETTFSPDYLQLRECLIQLFSLNDATYKEHADVLTKEALKLFDKKDWMPNNSHLNFAKQDIQYGYFQDCPKEAKALFKQLVVITRTIAVLIEKNNTAADTMAYDYAYKLMVVLVTPTELLSRSTAELFDIIAKRTDKLLAKKTGESTKPFHDLLIDFQLPNANGVDDLQGWQTFIQQEGSYALKLFANAHPIELKIAELAAPNKGCGLIATYNEISLKNKKETKADLLKKLPAHLNAAYVIVNNNKIHKIFYINRTSHQYIDLTIHVAHLKKLKEIFPQMESAEILSEAHLDLMALITDHRHQERQAPHNMKVARHIDRLCTYAREAENVAFSEICYKYGVLEKRFNAGLDFMAKHPEKTPDTLPVVTITGITKGEETECCFVHASETNKVFQQTVKQIQTIPLNFLSNAIYYQLNNTGYDIQLRLPFSSEEMEENTVYLHMEDYKKYFSISRVNSQVLCYTLKNSQGNSVTDILKIFTDIPMYGESDYEKTFKAIRKKIESLDNLQLTEAEKNTIVSEVSKRHPFPVEERSRKKLFYLNKITNQRIELFLQPEDFAELDQQFVAVDYDRLWPLSVGRLSGLSSYTHHAHKIIVDDTSYCWVKLPYSAHPDRFDPHVLILGDIANSCHSIGAEAGQCIQDALTLENNGQYVLLRQKKPGSADPFLTNGAIDYTRFEIVGESYVAKSSTGNLRLDSVEYLNSVPNSVIKSALTQFAKQVLAKNLDIKRVTVGDISQEAIKGMFNKTHMLEIMQEGFDYGDAREQSCIAERPCAHPRLIEDLERHQNKKLPLDVECIFYLSHYVIDLNFVDHFEEHRGNAMVTPWSVQLLLSFNRNPTLNELEPYYRWLENDADFELPSHIYNMKAYQAICHVPFESIALFTWQDIIQRSTLNEITHMALILGQLQINRRNFPAIDLSKIQLDNLPENYNRLQFLTVLILLVQDSPGKATDKTFEKLIELTNVFIQEHEINTPDRINVLTSENVINCCATQYPDHGGSVVSFRELAAINHLPISPEHEHLRMTFNVSLINELTSKAALLCYQLTNKDGNSLITLKDLEKTLDPSNIKKIISIISTSDKIMQALKEGLFTGEYIIEHYKNYEDKKGGLLIYGLQKKLFTIDDIDFLREPNVILALNKKLLCIADVKAFSVELNTPEVIQALIDKLFSIADFKTHPKLLSNLVVIDDIRNERLDIVEVISRAADLEKFKCRSRACSDTSSVDERVSHSPSGLFYHADATTHEDNTKSEKSSLDNEM